MTAEERVKAFLEREAAERKKTEPAPAPPPAKEEKPPSWWEKLRKGYSPESGMSEQRKQLKELEKQ